EDRNESRKRSCQSRLAGPQSLPNLPGTDHVRRLTGPFALPILRAHCLGGGIGRRSGFKIRRWRQRESSSLSQGTIRQEECSSPRPGPPVRPPRQVSTPLRPPRRPWFQLFSRSIPAVSKRCRAGGWHLPEKPVECTHCLHGSLLNRDLVR